MKLSITKTVTTEDELDIELPMFRRHNGMAIRITEDGKIIKAAPSFLCMFGRGDYSYDKDILDIIVDGKPITEREFHQALQRAVEAIAGVAGYEINLNLTAEPQTA